MGANVLYASYDGLLDPLGQSQVLPYIFGLQALGHRFTILSFEKPARLKVGASKLSRELQSKGIRWLHLDFSQNPPLLSKAWDLYRLKRTLKRLWGGDNYDFIHCRGHIPAIAAFDLNQSCGARYLFDVRGFWFDERVDSRIWDQRRWVFRKIYEHFKAKEPLMYSKASHLVTLTENARTILSNEIPSLAAPGRISVIPCCVDTELFRRNDSTLAKAERMRSEWNLQGTHPILVYLGSLGTWYLLEEMLWFFKGLLGSHPKAKFFLITPSQPTEVYRVSDPLRFPRAALLIKELARDDIPVALSLADVGIFFINPAPSKRSSSPTKLAEMLSMGLPVVCNSGVGDINTLLSSGSVGHLVRDFSDTELHRALADIPRLLRLDRTGIAQFAAARFSLSAGVAAYAGVYNQMLEISPRA